MKSWFHSWKTSRRSTLWGYGLLALIVNFAGQPALANNQIRLLAFGDSLTAGFGLTAADSFPTRLETALRAKGYSVTVINAGVSGDTSSGGRARLDWALADQPDAAIVELGANDMLRGLDPKLTETNLGAILTTLKQRGVKTLLAGMVAPPSIGREYAAEFDDIYPHLEDQYAVPLYPFFLNGVMLHPDLLQRDGLHPNPQGVEVIVRGILPQVEALITAPTPAKASP